ncbi:hypothetical protein TNCV_4677021 [Trichonephila clavipes]|nr:hypothetical protein TNCV_4677021 [Trichonephila clavipes]
MLEKVIENWTSRLDDIRASRGSPMPEIIFKMAQNLSLQGSPNVLRLLTVSGAPRNASVAHFRLLTEHDCLRSHPYRIGIADSTDCTLYDSDQPMTAEPMVM